MMEYRLELSNLTPSGTLLSSLSGCRRLSFLFSLENDSKSDSIDLYIFHVFPARLQVFREILIDIQGFIIYFVFTNQHRFQTAVLIAVLDPYIP